MSPVQQTEDETRIAAAVLRWIAVAREHGRENLYGPAWMPGSIDAAKSSLLRRLLDGKEPLPVPPPRAHSYPWYEIVETGRTQLSAMFIEGPYDRAEGTFIHVAQHPWKVLRTEGAGRWIVSYRDGEEWLLRRLTDDDEREACGKRRVDTPDGERWEDLPCDWLLVRLPLAPSRASEAESDGSPAS
jgi:hypothetical protein